ncbi:helix-turn-helix domain-containing protein [Nocardiopsis dassonvillei]|uniref:helix-turn-helix domain-containing protein n=1 Tax=Nocardiopsis dassonvillei TaxID=2014 RepID=UPI00363E82DA
MADAFDQILGQRPYLEAGEIARDGQAVTVVYTYSHGADERLIIAAAQQGTGGPPVRWVRSWLADWERVLDSTTLTISGPLGMAEITLRGRLGETEVTVRAVPAALPHPRAARVHPLVTRLRAAREAQGRTADGLAATLGYAPNALWRWEHGEACPSLDQFTDLAQELGYGFRLVQPDAGQLDAAAAAVRRELLRRFDVQPDSTAVAGDYAALADDAHALAAVALAAADAYHRDGPRD